MTTDKDWLDIVVEEVFHPFLSALLEEKQKRLIVEEAERTRYLEGRGDYEI